MAFLRGSSRPLSPLLQLVLLAVLQNAGAQLAYDYYANSCPNVETIVRGILGANLFTDLTAPAALARLAFHDCQVQGCDASIMLNSAPGITSELDAPLNLGIRRLDFIDRIKGALETACPGTVSCADIIALAGRDVINLSGGPRIPIPLGRRDGTTASAALAQQELPPATISVSNAIQLFGAMGMTVTETVAILGAHTLGVAHCVNFVNRLYPAKDPSMGLLFYSTLTARCPPLYSSSTTVSLDRTNLLFDNQYYRSIDAARGLLTIDSELGLDPRTGPIVTEFANSINAFFQAFSSAYVKMVSFNVLTGSEGEVRTNCGSVN